MTCDRKIGPYPCCSVVQGDCLELMRQIPAEIVDVIWTDPPYGHANHDGDWNARLNDHRGIENKPIANDSADDMRLVVDGMLHEAARVLKRDCCCCCCCGGGGPKPTFAWLAERMDRDGMAFFHSVIWDKRNPGLGWRFRRQHEMVMVAHRKGGKLRWNLDEIAVPNIVECMPSRERLHPNEKPESLLLSWLYWVSQPDDLILDPFAGSGTTLSAAKKLGRHYLGFELDPTYAETARNRLETIDAQPTLFEPKPEQISLGDAHE